VVVLLLSFFNLFLKPLLVLFTLPFILLTMGLGLIVINALLFLFVGWLVEGFYVASFWSALGGACVVSVTNFVMSRMLRASAPTRPTPKRDDVIDI
jgi:putative membrane protein